MNNSLEIIIVLYKCSLNESLTFRTLQKQLKDIKLNYELIIYNNDIQRKIEDSRYLIVNSDENQKLSGAYNFALERAVKHNRKWLLLLDQDTKLPDNFFNVLQGFFSKDYFQDLVAIVPKLISDGKQVSPKIISSNMRFERDINKTGYNNIRINAFNSMSLLSVNFIQSIGGFCKDYKFDMLDHWYYNQIYKCKKLIYVLDICAEHNSSFNRFEHNISISRYREYISAENNFMHKQIGLRGFVFYKMKLIMRSFKQLINFKNKKYALLTLSFIFKK